MAAFQDREIAQQYVVAVLERDRLVADAGLLRHVDGVVAAGGPLGAEAEPFAVDQSRAGDAEVVDVFAPQQGIVPVVMTVILIGVPFRFGLCWVVDAAAVPRLFA